MRHGDRDFGGKGCGNIFISGAIRGAMCAKISTDCTFKGLLTKSILDGYSVSDLSGLNLGTMSGIECSYCSKLGVIGADWKS